MGFFHGVNKHHSYFEGWYLKHQNKTDGIAFIPAFHVDDKGHKRASLQIITNEVSHSIEYPIDMFRVSRKTVSIGIGNNIFSEAGCSIYHKSKELNMSGHLYYGPFKKPIYDIMGPFRWVPFMECRHSIFSLTHIVNGMITINDKEYRFNHDCGYMEGDRGCSFPKKYIWTQCNWKNNCIMVSIADIPFCGGSFIGCIGTILFQGKEFRIATYLNVKLIHISQKTFCLRQGPLTLLVELLEQNVQPLYAPINGNMERTIHESIASKVRYTCIFKDKVIFHFISNQASYETSWKEN